MTKHLIVARAKPGLSREQALDHLRNRHAVIVTNAPNLRRSLKRYIQNHVFDVPSATALGNAWDWIIEGWYDDDVVHPEPPRDADLIAVREDLQTFPDWKTLLRFPVFEELVFEEGAARCDVRLFRFTQRRSGISIGGFRRAWRLAAFELSDLRRARGAAAHVQNYSLQAAEAAAYDVVDSFSFSSAFDAIAFLNAGLDEPSRTYVDECSEAGRSFALIAQAHVIFDDSDATRMTLQRDPEWLA